MAPTKSLRPPLAVSPRRRPPLAVLSPRRLRPRPHRLVRSDATFRTPAAPSSMASRLPNRPWALEESEFRPGYEMISAELQSMAKRVKQEFGNNESSVVDIDANSLFERGRFYEEYSARRNERLKRKKREAVDEMCVQEPAIDVVELGKKRDVENVENLRRSVPANFSVGREERILRSSLRSSKEVKMPFTSANSGVGSVMRIGSRSCLRK